MEVLLLILLITSIINLLQNKKIMGVTDDLRLKIASQGATLDTINTNLVGIRQDVTFLKDKLTGLEGGATAAEIAELSTAVDGVSTKIDGIATDSADLDAQTDSGTTTEEEEV